MPKKILFLLFFSTISRYCQLSILLVIPWYSKNVLKKLYYDYYFHRQDNLWRQNALKTLPVLLNSSDMLACGEDLGLIPSCVHPVCWLNYSQPSPTFLSSLLISQGFIFLILHIIEKNLSSNWLILIQVMQELGLIGLRIQRMPSEPGLEFGIPSQYSYMTVRSCACFIVVQLVITRMGFYRFIFWYCILKWFIILNQKLKNWLLRSHKMYPLNTIHDAKILS